MEYVRKYDYFDSNHMKSIHFIITWHSMHKRWIPLYAAYNPTIRDQVFETLQKHEGMWMDLYSLGISWNGRWANRIEALDNLTPPDEIFDVKVSGERRAQS